MKASQGTMAGTMFMGGPDNSPTMTGFFGFFRNRVPTGQASVSA